MWRSGARQTGSIWVMVDRSIAGVAAFPNGRTSTVTWANRARIVQGRINTETGGEMEGEVRFVGIDVSKAQLDVAVRPTGKRWVLPYDETGIEGLIPQLVDLEPALVLLEATGGLELPLVAGPGRCGTAGGGGQPTPGQGLRQGHRNAGARPTLWTRGSWPISPTPSVLTCAPSRTPRPRSSTR